MNSFAFRYVKNDGQFQAEYRLSHWAGYRTVRFENGQPKVFSHPLDAAICAANELVSALNGNQNFWHGKTGDEARAAAERLFKAAAGTTDDQSKNPGSKARQASEELPAGT